MAKFVVALLILVAAGIPAFIMVRGAVIEFDVTSEQHPLGTFGDVDAWLREHKYEENSFRESAMTGPEGAVRHRYRETYGGESGHFLCYVDLWVDGEGEVRKLAAEFTSRSRSVDPAYTRSQGLAHSLWTVLSGSPPTFRDDDITPSPGAMGLRSDFTKGQVVASWVKVYTDTDREHSIVDTVTFEMK